MGPLGKSGCRWSQNACCSLPLMSGRRIQQQELRPGALTPTSGVPAPEGRLCSRARSRRPLSLPAFPRRTCGARRGPSVPSAPARAGVPVPTWAGRGLAALDQALRPRESQAYPLGASSSCFGFRILHSEGFSAGVSATPPLPQPGLGQSSLPPAASPRRTGTSSAICSAHSGFPRGVPPPTGGPSGRVLTPQCPSRVPAFPSRCWLWPRAEGEQDYSA